MIIVVGTTTVDLLLTGIDRVPPMGSDEFTAGNLAFTNEPLQMVLGGNGGNCAYALARLGAPVLLCSAVGRDAPGDLAAGWLREAGVDAAGLVRSAFAATSTTTILTDRLRNRLAFHHPGATARFEEVWVPPEASARADVLLITSYPLLQGWRPDGVAAALAAAHDGGCRTALDVGPAIGAPIDLGELGEFLPDVDFLLCNEHELAACTQTTDPETGVHRLFEAGAQTLVLKQGRRGVTLYEGRATAPCVVPAFPAEGRSTVGAGDAFNAGFLFGVREGWRLQHAARFAHAVAARVVEAARGGLGAPDLAEVEAFLARHKPHPPSR